MRVLKLCGLFAGWWLVAAPASAFAVEVTDRTGAVVPEWLSVVAGAFGLIIAVVLLVDAYHLRRVAEGSMVAVNIAYMSSAVGCFAASTILRWVEIFAGDTFLIEQVSFAADLLVIAGMALLAVYFYRVRKAMTSYLTALSGTAERMARASNKGEATRSSTVEDQDG